MGQFHCRWCGAMCLAGLPHPDWTEELKAEAERLADDPIESDVDNETSWGLTPW